MPANRSRQADASTEATPNLQTTAGNRPADARLGRWLRRLRETTLPERVDLRSNTVGRRARGLTQRDVARLAGFTPRTYWTWESGQRLPAPSNVNAIAQALHLDDVQTAHLHRLASPGSAQPLDRPSIGQVSSVLSAIAAPAVAYDETTTVFASNDSFRALAPTLGTGASAPNLLLWYFTSDDAKSTFVDWQHTAQNLIARLRVAESYYADTSAFDALLATLCKASTVADRLWAEGLAVAAEPTFSTYRLRDRSGHVHETPVATLQPVGYCGPALRISVFL